MMIAIKKEAQTQEQQSTIIIKSFSYSSLFSFSASSSTIMVVSDGSKFLRPGNPSLADTLKDIRKDIIPEFPKQGPHPYIGIDVSIDINIFIKHKEACQQQHMQPPTPIVAVANSV